MEQILIFQIGPEYLGLEAIKILQVSEPMTPVRVPTTPEYISGIANFRGSVIPVIDVRKRLGIAVQPNQSEPMMIVAEEEDRKIGLIVDRVVGLRQIKIETLAAHADLVATKTEKDFFKNIARLPEYPVFVLDLKKILTK